MRSCCWLLSKVKPPIDVAMIGQTIANIDAQMSNLFSLTQHATTQKTIDSLGMMMQTLEMQKFEAEAMLFDAFRYKIDVTISEIMKKITCDYWHRWTY
jgi:hypothetical protein